MRKILPALVAGALLLSSCSPSQPADEGGSGGAVQVPDHLVIKNQPTLTDLGAAMAPAIKVEVRDAGNDLVDSSDVDSITVVVTPNSGTTSNSVGGTTTRAVVSGVATFNDLTFTDEGTGFTLTFSATNVPSVTWDTSSAFSVTNNSNFIYFSRFNGATWDVWRMKEDGTQQTQFTNRAMAGDPAPAKNPQSSRVAFSDGPYGIQSLWVVNSDTTGLRQIQTRSDAGETTWSPNGQVIASQVAAGAPSFGLFTINGDGTNRQQLGGGVMDYPTWSPGSDKIAYALNYLQLNVTGASGGLGDFILKSDTTNTGAGVLRTAAGDSVFGFTNSAAAFVPFTYLQTFILQPAWSPDGMRIAFELQDRNGVSHIFAISNLGGGVLVPLTKLATFSDRSPTWSPDGTKIFFSSNRSGSWQIWWMYANGTSPTMLTNTANNYSPSWWN